MTEAEWTNAGATRVGHLYKGASSCEALLEVEKGVYSLITHFSREIPGQI